MGLFDKIERKLEGVVNGGFARAFKGDVQPVEIAARLQKLLDAEARLLSKDTHLVPNAFTVRLSTHDYDRLVPYSSRINAEIIPQLHDYAQGQGYEFTGPVSVEYILDANLPTGRFTTTSSVVEGQPDESAVTRRSALVLEVNGVRHPLVSPGFTIGRGAEADVRVSDAGISRVHARILVDGPAEDPEIFIEDLDSTNGVIVNGQRVQRAALAEGSRIELGKSRLLIRTPVHDV